MIKVIETTTQERMNEQNTAYNNFIDYYYTTSLTIEEILRKLDISQGGSLHRGIRRLMKENDDYDAKSRAFKIRKGTWIV